MNRLTELERDADAGDPQAQFAFASYLFGELTPESFHRAVELTESAARGGYPDAVSQLATIEATGAARPQNFERALDLLADAAKRGSEHAQAQLRLLSGGDGEDWTARRGRIDLSRLLSVPARIAVSESPRVRVIEGFADRAVCEWVIARARDKLSRAMIWDEESGMGKVDPARSNSAVELRLTDVDVVLAILRARISLATRIPEPVFETPQVMHYSVGQEFKAHVDYLDAQVPGQAVDMARRGQRIATFLIYLNDGFEGGETEFPQAGLRYRGRTGDAIFFANVGLDGQADPKTLHAGRPPTKGEKWIFSQWIRDRTPGAPPPAAS